jgi:hypothetical protein
MLRCLPTSSHRPIAIMRSPTTTDRQGTARKKACIPTATSTPAAPKTTRNRQSARARRSGRRRCAGRRVSLQCQIPSNRREGRAATRTRMGRLTPPTQLRSERARDLVDFRGEHPISSGRPGGGHSQKGDDGRFRTRQPWLNAFACELPYWSPSLQTRFAHSTFQDLASSCRRAPNCPTIRRWSSLS